MKGKRYDRCILRDPDPISGHLTGGGQRVFSQAVAGGPHPACAHRVCSGRDGGGVRLEPAHHPFCAAGSAELVQNGHPHRLRTGHRHLLGAVPDFALCREGRVGGHAALCSECQRHPQRCRGGRCHRVHRGPFPGPAGGAGVPGGSGLRQCRHSGPLRRPRGKARPAESGNFPRHPPRHGCQEKPVPDDRFLCADDRAVSGVFRLSGYRAQASALGEQPSHAGFFHLQRG